MAEQTFTMVCRTTTFQVTIDPPRAPVCITGSHMREPDKVTMTDCTARSSSFAVTVLWDEDLVAINLHDPDTDTEVLATDYQIQLPLALLRQLVAQTP